MKPIVVALFGAAFRVAYISPVGRFITGAFKPGGIDECFGKTDRMIIRIEPIMAETFQIQGQNFGSKMFYLNPG